LVPSFSSPAQVPRGEASPGPAPGLPGWPGAPAAQARIEWAGEHVPAPGGSPLAAAAAEAKPVWITGGATAGSPEQAPSSAELAGALEVPQPASSSQEPPHAGLPLAEAAAQMAWERARRAAEGR